ncbi:SGNH/GDSL hydrolase family protein [Aureimonas fodinaquatilis]|uniref:SGNH/GDSL hydrolase family protein n=1 Tax=Aureimonas fodinaquatilis TaxID=2565783 RepID=A0A5B0DZ84_9HYPH|nr:SGNH/GDSL hydrolase family protein [Aureimonas fodinaquatilis]KAA0971155.1 SGNH/GDSL hydrolase family protein [Aureimonas fodinaquatilis]
MPLFLKAMLSWLLFPVYVWQGLALRRSVERLHPPQGPTSGYFGPTALAADPEIRLLVLGDSAAAGVGVEQMEDSLAARLAERLHVVSGLTVAWRAVGSNGAVSAEVRDYVVPNIARDPYTHIVLMVGTNDVKNFHRLKRFKTGFGGLLYSLRARWPQARIVWSPPVDMKRVPALPRGIATVLEMRADLVRKLGARLCLERGAIPSVSLPRVEPAGFSRDGFHASVEGSAYYAGHLVDYVIGDRLALNFAKDTSTASS